MKNAISTERLVLRRFKISDKKQMHELFSDSEAMRLCGIMPPLKDISETRRRLQEWASDEGRYAITSGGKAIGYIAVFRDSEEGREDTRELAFGLIGRYRHQGYMQEAIRGILEELKKESVAYVWACCYKENVESGKLIESLGFELQNEGTFDSANDKTYETYEYRIHLEA